MAKGGRSSRGGGKRGAASSSASACAYYATTGLLVALCVAGAYFLTSTSAASADGDAAGTVTSYRHTTRSSFAYEVTREKAPPSPPRKVEADDARSGKAAESGSDEEGAEEERKSVATAAALDDPHAKPDDRDQEHVADEESMEGDHNNSAAAMEEERSEEGDHVDAGEANAEDAAATITHGGEDKEQEALLEESHEPREQEQQLQLQMPREETRAAVVEEKSLDGGTMEETNAGQRQREHEQINAGQAAGGDLRREAQEEPHTNGDERTEQEPEEERQQHQPEEERSNDQPQSEEEGHSTVSDASGEAFRNQDEDGGDGDKPAVSEQMKDADSNASQDDHSVADSLVGEARTEEQKAWATQADQSHREKDRREENAGSNENDTNGADNAGGEEHEWRVCNVKAGADYIPCLDNEKAIKKLRPENYRRYEHRERHCPDEGPTCLVPLPSGYRRPVEWPKSRDRIWYSNVPHTKLVAVKGHQNWVKVSGQYLTFPGGGTQFIHGALHYIDFLQQSVRGIAWGKHTRVVLDVGCGVASFGGYLFERDVVTVSFAPKDEHEAQVQMALERGIPAISAVMGSKRLPFPSKAFDLVHCARCRVPWHADGGALLLELNRVLRPGGFFVWSATPVYQKLTEDVEIWKAMSSLTKSMCWELVSIKKDRLNGVGVAFYRKPTSNECYETRRRQQPPMCSDDDDADAAWYIRLNSCMHRVPTGPSERGTRWPVEWPRRVRTPPYWLNSSQAGVYGKPAPEDFTVDYEHWRRVVDRSYLNGLGVDWSRVRNVMDMRAAYGGFAAALREKKIWVMNVVNVDAPDTLPIIFERGLFGMYHDWCESFSTYPRTYDLLHADHLFSKIKERCAVLPVVVEVDRIVRPGGSIIVRDEAGAVGEVEKLLRSLHWDVRLTFSKNDEGVLYAEKSDWRPELLEEPS
ncbi:probable methyltransferase PMT24 [Phragmites australis]|uniref:probable methyltransferase PMT24 n=1 Tax=Phragmites australis TaxID=29695 RepID=UPI002D78180B|nr:probable methyltransferase PMT24 [Phragmites australis]